jgi:hypothetical protein
MVKGRLAAAPCERSGKQQQLFFLVRKSSGIGQLRQGSEMNERRSASRKKSFLQGRIFYNHGRNSIDCLVRDFSEQGARLKFPGAVATPDVVELHIPNKDETFRATVQWRSADEMGVVFDGHETAPPLVPGTPAGDVAGRLQKLEHDFGVLQRKVNEMQAVLRQIQGAD